MGEHISAGEYITGLISGFPDAERIFLEQQEIVSLAAIPLFVHKRWWGFIGLDDCRDRRTWSSMELDALKTAGTIIASWIARGLLPKELSRDAFIASLHELAGSDAVTGRTTFKLEKDALPPDPGCCFHHRRLPCHAPWTLPPPAGGTGHEGLRRGRQPPGGPELPGKGKPDLVIMDLELGDGSPSGFDLVKELKALLGEIPILVFTMHDEDFFRVRSFSAGADGFVSKKGEVMELLAAIHSVREGKTWGIVSTGVEPLIGPWNLSQREFEVFNLLGQGKSAKAISEILNIGCKTVESHKYSIRKKMEFASVEELRQYAIKWQHAGTRQYYLFSLKMISSFLFIPYTFWNGRHAGRYIS